MAHEEERTRRDQGGGFFAETPATASEEEARGGSEPVRYREVGDDRSVRSVRSISESRLGRAGN